jgi:hypothetical protein
MQLRSLALATFVFIITPRLAAASDFRKSLDACVKAFERTLAAESASEPPYKVTFLGDRFSEGSAQYLTVFYTFDLAAKDRETGKIYTRVQCVANGRRVSSLSSLPLLGESKTSTEASIRSE